MTYLDIDKNSARGYMPRGQHRRSRYLYLETDLGQAKGVVETFGRYPRFALLPLKWYTKDFQPKHLKYFFFVRDGSYLGFGIFAGSACSDPATARWSK